MAVLIYPFATARRNSRQVQSGDGRLDTQAHLEEIYAAIETLRLEHQLGNIPQDLYQEQLNGYRLEAAKALRLKSQMGSSDLDILLEQEILAVRTSLEVPDESEAESPESNRNA